MCAQGIVWNASINTSNTESLWSFGCGKTLENVLIKDPNFYIHSPFSRQGVRGELRDICNRTWVTPLRINYGVCSFSFKQTLELVKFCLPGKAVCWCTAEGAACSLGEESFVSFSPRKELMASKPHRQSAVCCGQCAGEAPVIHTNSWIRGDKLWHKCLYFCTEMLSTAVM